MKMFLSEQCACVAGKKAPTEQNAADDSDNRELPVAHTLPAKAGGGGRFNKCDPQCLTPYLQLHGICVAASSSLEDLIVTWRQHLSRLDALMRFLPQGG